MKLLLLVQSESDVSHLDAAAKAIIFSNIQGTWLVFSPAVLVNATDAASALDAEITQLQSAERAAADRGDYTAAAGYKVAREGKVLDRAKEIRDAHKKLTAEQRATRTKELFGPFHAQLQSAGRNAKISSHSDHYDRDQWVAMLNSLTGVWFKEFSPGSFVVAWPESIATSIKKGIWLASAEESMAKINPPEIAEVAPKTRRGELTEAQKREFEEKSRQRLPQVPKGPQSRGEELQGLRTFALMAEAKKVGVDPKGKAKPALIEEILAAEAVPAKAEAELATY